VTDAQPAGLSSAGEPGWITRVFGTRRFFALFNVQVISALGDWVGFFAITSLAASISSQPEAAIALVTTARVAPGVFLAPFAGVLVDRFDRKVLMIVADLSRCLIFLLLPLVRTIPGLIVASLFLELFTMIWSPAKEATVPLVVPTEKLTTANSLSLVAAYATMPVAGPIQYGLKTLNDHIAGVGFLGFLGLNHVGDTQTLAFYFNAVSFALAAFILWRFVFRGLPPSGSRARATGEVTTVVVDDLTGESVKVDAEADPDERSSVRRTFDEIREGFQFIYVNPVVRAVILGLATGLVGGAMLVPLGPTFARFVIGDANTFPLFITAMGFGVATGVVLLSLIQKRIPRELAFPILVVGAGVSMFVGVSMATFWLAALGVFGLGLCAGAVYVLGFTLLQEHTDEELRGRIFATMLTLVRMCVLLALVLGPILATVFNGFARSATDAPDNEVPEVSIFGFDLAIPGVRITLWLAAIIIILAGVLAGRSMREFLRSGIREGIRDAISTNHQAEASRSNHPTSNPGDGSGPQLPPPLPPPSAPPADGTGSAPHVPPPYTGPLARPDNGDGGATTPPEADDAEAERP